MEQNSLERGSLERGVSLVEAVLAFAVAGVFILGGLFLFGQASHNTRMNEMGTHLAYAMEEVRGANPTGWFKGTSATRWSRYIPGGGETPHGKIRVMLRENDPGDAFRLVYENIPAADIEEICEPLRQRVQQNPHIDGSACGISSGMSDLEIRVRREESPPITVPLQYIGMPDCQNACNTDNWRGPMPTAEEMLVLRETLELVSILHSAHESCNTRTLDNLVQCFETQKGYANEDNRRLTSPDGKILNIVGHSSSHPRYVRRDLTQDGVQPKDYPPHFEPYSTENYLGGIVFEIDRSVYEILEKYDTWFKNDNLHLYEGYRGMEGVHCTSSRCELRASINHYASSSFPLAPWWYKE